MKIELYQTWQDQYSYPEDRIDLLTFDYRQNSDFYKRENAHLIRLHNEVIQKSEL